MNMWCSVSIPAGQVNKENHPNFIHCSSELFRYISPRPEKNNQRSKKENFYSFLMKLHPSDISSASFISSRTNSFADLTSLMIPAASDTILNLEPPPRPAESGPPHH